LAATGSYFLGAGERSRQEVTWRAFAAGVLLGLAASVRLYAIALLFPLAWTVAGSARCRLRRFGLCSLGLAIGLLPLVVPLLLDPEQARFGLVGYHVQRSGASVWSLKKLRILGQLVGVLPDEVGLALQFDLLAALACVGVWAHWMRRAQRLPALPWLLTVLVVSWVPTPTYVQYFTLAVPFLVELAVVGLDAIRENRRALAHRLWPWLGVTWLALTGIEVERHLHGGRNVQGVVSRDHAAQWTIPAVRRVARALSDCHGADTALVSWPGYLVESTLQPLAGTENHFNREIADRIEDATLRARLHLATTRELAAAQSSAGAPIVVIGNWSLPDNLHRPVPGHRLATALAPVQIWVDDRSARCAGLLAK
jgi:fumarate reductase subunit D